MTCQHLWHSMLFRRGKAPLIRDWCVTCGVRRPGYKAQHE